MKKLIAILTALTMLFGVVCAFAEEYNVQEGEELLEELAEEVEEVLDDIEDLGEETDDEDDEDFDGMTGYWEVAADPTVTPERKAIFDKGMEGLLGVDYVPVVYLGSQVVAGTNHAFLCQGTIVVPNAVPEWMVVYLYEDLQGNVSVLDIGGFDVGAFCFAEGEEDE